MEEQMVEFTTVFTVIATCESRRLNSRYINNHIRKLRRLNLRNGARILEQFREIKELDTEILLDIEASDVINAYIERKVEARNEKMRNLQIKLANLHAQIRTL